MKLTVAYLKWREGRPRWEPGPRLRECGFRGRDLKSDSGEWLDLEGAIDAAKALNDEVAAWRAEGTQAPRTEKATSTRSCQALYERYTGGEDERKASPKWQRLRASTKVDYRSKLRIFLAEFGEVNVQALEHHHLYQWWEELYEERGHAMANGTIRVVSSMLSYMRRIGWRKDNPAIKLDMESVAPRVVTWTPAEISHMIKTATELKLPSIADAIVIALHTGQRRGDVLALEMPQVTASRALFRQSKRGARVSVPFTPPLKAQLEQIRSRRADAGGTVTDLAAARRAILDEKGRPFDGPAGADRFGRAFREVRAEAAKEMPQIASKLFLDLRDTAVTRLALADCTIPEIRTITGHKMENIHQVLAHYIAQDDRMADNAIGKLKTYMAQEGIAI